MAVDIKIFRLPGVVERTGLSPATVWRLVRAGRFPAPIRLGVRAVGWRRADIQTWVASRPVLQ